MAAGPNGPSLARALTARTAQGFTQESENVFRQSITEKIVPQDLVRFSPLRMELNIKLRQNHATAG